MPEIPEIKILTNFINKVGQCDDFKVVLKNTSFKKNDMNLNGKLWKISAKSKNKEFILILQNTVDRTDIQYISIVSSKILNFEIFDTIDDEYIDKYAEIVIYGNSKIYMFSDIIHFSYGKKSNGEFNSETPDIINDNNNWRAYMYKHRKNKKFNHPVFEIMHEKQYFPGIGTYLRSEILARTRFSPFTPCSEIFKHEILREDFFIAIKETIEEVIQRGGLQFRYWKNPFGVKTKLATRAYKKKGYKKIQDSAGRVLWFSPKWRDDYHQWQMNKKIR